MASTPTSTLLAVAVRLQSRRTVTTRQKIVVSMTAYGIILDTTFIIEGQGEILRRKSSLEFKLLQLPAVACENVYSTHEDVQSEVLYKFPEVFTGISTY